MNFKLKNLKNDYKENLDKVVLFFIIIVVFTLTVVYIPYLNILFSLINGLALVVISWYVLFHPSQKTLIIISLIALFFAYGFTFLKIVFIQEMLGNLIFLFLVFILINLIKESIKNEDKSQQT